MQSANITRSDLANYYENHLIPDVDLSFEYFPDFLAVREKLIMERLAELFDVEISTSDTPA